MFEAKRAKKLVASLERIRLVDEVYIRGTGKFEIRKVEVPFYQDEYEDGRIGIRISAEHGIFTGDYYQEFALEFNPILQAWAKRNKVFFEWINPGEFGVYE